MACVRLAFVMYQYQICDPSFGVLSVLALAISCHCATDIQSYIPVALCEQEVDLPLPIR